MVKEKNWKYLRLAISSIFLLFIFYKLNFSFLTLFSFYVRKKNIGQDDSTSL